MLAMGSADTEEKYLAAHPSSAQDKPSHETVNSLNFNVDTFKVQRSTNINTNSSNDATTQLDRSDETAHSQVEAVKTEEVVTSKNDGTGNENSTISNDNKLDEALCKEQLKYCGTVLRGLKRHSMAPAFLVPVDPIALNIPDYFNIIKEPMDLSLITQRYESGEYKTPQDFESDIRLMLRNCFTYNHPDSAVTKMGRALEKYFDGSYAKLPKTLSPPTFAVPKNTSPASMAASRARREPKAPRRMSEGTVVTNPSTAAKRAPKGNPEIAFCAGIIRELTKKIHTPYSWPFLEPVDPVKLGIPDYFDVIQRPMDISTVRVNLEAGRYASAEAFEADVRLIFSNCLTYNAPDSDVVSLCRQFEAVFNEKWSQKPSKFTPPARSNSSLMQTSLSNGGNFTEDFDSDSERILEINRQIQDLQQQLSALLMRRRNRSSSIASSSASISSVSGQAPKRKPSSSTGGVARTTPRIISEDEFLSRPMSFEEKRKLSVEVNELSPERLGRVVEIIQAGMDLEAEGDSDTIELDIESLDVKTLRSLQRYVMECRGITNLSEILGETAPAPKRKKPTTSQSTVSMPPPPAPALAQATSSIAPGVTGAAVPNNSRDEMGSSEDDLD